MRTILAGLAFGAILLAPRIGQAQETDEIKKKIQEEVRKLLKAEEERILAEITKIIEAQLSKMQKRESWKENEGEGEGVKAHFGAFPEELDEAAKKELGIETGVRLARVEEGSPAEKAGLKTGDVLTELDGRTVDSMMGLFEIVHEKSPGDTVKVEYIRGKQRKSATVKLGEFSGPPGGMDEEFRGREEGEIPKAEEKGGPAWIGIVPAELGEAERAQLKLEKGVGLAVAKVKAESPAAKAGLQKGDVVLQIGSVRLQGIESLQKFLKSAHPGDVCEIVLLRKGEQKKIRITLGVRKA